VFTPKIGSSTTEVSTAFTNNQAKHKHRNEIKYAKCQWNGRIRKKNRQEKIRGKQIQSKANPKSRQEMHV
jgi:hypothetical protein